MPIDHTTIECLQRCEQEAVFRHVRHLTSPEESLAAFFGRVVHEGVRVLYDAEKGESGVGGGAQHHHEIVKDGHVGNFGIHQEHDDFYGVSLMEEALIRQEAADRATTACLSYWSGEVDSESVVLPAASSSKPDHRTPQLAAAIVRLYASMYGDAQRRGYDVVMNERYLALGGTNVGVSDGLSRGVLDGAGMVPDAPPPQAIECGVVDRVVRRHADGLLYVLDLKTSSWAPNKGYWRQWSNSQQATIYLDLVEAELQEGVAGFWCDHIFVSARRAGPEPGDFMQFGPVTYSAAKRQELREQREQWREHFRKLLGGQTPRQSTRSCFRFNSACSFLGYCSADPADREAMVQRDLQVGTLVERAWNPAERDI